MCDMIKSMNREQISYYSIITYILGFVNTSYNIFINILLNKAQNTVKIPLKGDFVAEKKFFGKFYKIYCKVKESVV